MQRLNDCWMAPPEREHAEAGQEVQIPVPLVVNEVAALPLHVETIELDLTENPRELRVDVPRVEGEVLAPALVQHLLQIKGHAVGSRGSLSGRWRQVSGVASLPTTVFSLMGGFMR